MDPQPSLRLPLLVDRHPEPCNGHRRPEACPVVGPLPVLLGDQPRRRRGNDPTKAVVGVLARCRRQQAEAAVLVGGSRSAGFFGHSSGPRSRPRRGCRRGFWSKLSTPTSVRPNGRAAHHPHVAPALGHGADVLAVGKRRSRGPRLSSPPVSPPTARRPTGRPPQRTPGTPESPGSTSALLLRRSRPDRSLPYSR